MVRLPGLGDSVKFGPGFTVSWMMALCVKLPEVPVILTVTVPVAAI